MTTVSPRTFCRNLSNSSNGSLSSVLGSPQPWRSKAFDESDTMIKGVTAQNGGTGTITCKIIIDGKVEVENSSNGQYAVVSCNGDLF
ncbi:hypothetical protein BJD58_gp34 [Gordonia phage UmaThurman]|uniref:hypothetical protein n=1 Tax=Gordonia phage UmaThurman TaxID=1821563 RepID=UPI00078D1F9D|nr:hypothetical protein BJD58_gp34 [Gordonia phage UmaThurman]AMS03934.1 hypothetical protein SEA_UMATHURMAN_34 [Gordonia phage UmaThurman]